MDAATPRDIGPGHNTDSIGGDALRAFIERIERLEGEKHDIACDIREVYIEAKGNGYDTGAIREIIKLRKQDAAARQEREAILQLYMDALGLAL
jgi:uncharacterized protein (UPF0335 family)